MKTLKGFIFGLFISIPFAFMIIKLGIPQFMSGWLSCISYYVTYCIVTKANFS